MLPKIQIFYNTLSVTRVNNTLKVSFRPNNCTYNLQNSTIRQNDGNVSRK